MNVGQLLSGVFLAGMFILYLPDMLGASGGGGTGQGAPAAAPGPPGDGRRRGFDHSPVQLNLDSESAVLQRASDGHFYAFATIGGQEYRFLVDTGASMVALTAADAQAMGFAWTDEDIIPIGRGASGDVQGVPVTIESMELAGVQLNSIKAAIIPEGLDVSLLGQSFLSKVGNMQVSEDEMTLGGG